MTTVDEYNEYNVLNETPDISTKRYLSPSGANKINYEDAMRILNEIKIKDENGNPTTFEHNPLNTKDGYTMRYVNLQPINITTDSYGSLLEYILKILIPDVKTKLSDPSGEQNKITLIRRAIIIKFAQIVTKNEGNDRFIPFNTVNDITLNLTFLLQADLQLNEAIQKIKNRKPVNEALVNELDKLAIRMGYMQGLILLKSIKDKRNISPEDLFTPVIKAINDKIDVVNTMLFDSLGIDNNAPNETDNAVGPTPPPATTPRPPPSPPRPPPPPTLTSTDLQPAPRPTQFTRTVGRINITQPTTPLDKSNDDIFPSVPTTPVQPVQQLQPLLNPPAATTPLEPLQPLLNPGTNKYTQHIDPYYNKYLKYKQKYLSLKNN